MPTIPLSPALRSTLVRPVLLGVSVVAFVLLFQTLTRVWTSDLGSDPDEPAHAVTSLMVRDYLVSGLPQSPLPFAQRYYDTYPKVALGHYPPGYYGLGSLFLLAWRQPQVLLILQALLTGCLAVQVYALGKRMLRDFPALIAALLTVSFPVTLKLTQLVMADIMLACLCLLAVECWARFLEAPKVKWAVLFGFAAAAAILTKGSGMALALVPVVSIALLKRWELLKKPAFWCAALPVAVLAGPWMLYSSKITKEGMVSEGVLAYARNAVEFYAFSLSSTFGLMTVMVAVPGLALWLGWMKRKLRPDPWRSALLGLLLGTLLVMLLVPTGFSTRYFMPVVPVVALLAVSFFEVNLAQTKLVRFGQGCLVMLLWLQIPTFLVKNVSGYQTAVKTALEKPPAGDHWLVCADPRGEGAVIASAAFALPYESPPVLTVHRGSKELSTADWLGRDYKPAFETSEALQGYLDQTGIKRVFVELLTAEDQLPPHEKLLLQTLRSNPQWKQEQEHTLTRPYLTEPGTLRVFGRIN